MRTYSILVGKCYRTRSGEIREVSGYLNGEITYTTHIVYENSNGKAAPHLPLERSLMKLKVRFPALGLRQLS